MKSRKLEIDGERGREKERGRAGKESVRNFTGALQPYV